MFPKQARGKQKRLTSYFPGDKRHPSSTFASSAVSRKRPRSVSGGDFRSRNGGSGFGVCPLCQRSFAWHLLESHASECTGEEINSRSNCHNNGDGDCKTPPTKATAPPPVAHEKTAEVPIQSPLEDCHKLEFPNATRTPNAATKITAAKSSSTTSNIVTPRLAPIFQAKPIDKNASPKEQQLRPHSYEPIPGLFVYEDFITPEEEARIVKACLDVPDKQILPAWKLCRFNGKHIGKRWGVHCNLRDRRVDAPEHPLPKVLLDIVVPKLRSLKLPAMVQSNFCPNEANAIDYRRKQGHWLKAHVDDRRLSKEPIANLSLVGDCYMTFSNIKPQRSNSNHQHQPQTQRVLLQRRCLQVLTGKARYDFSHGIANADLLSDRRISVTMRESPRTHSTHRSPMDGRLP